MDYSKWINTECIKTKKNNGPNNDKQTSYDIKWILHISNILLVSASSDDSKYNCNYCNNKKNVYKASNMETKESDCPSDYQDYGYNIK